MKNLVLGMWRPETITALVGGKTMEPFGPKPTGLFAFTRACISSSSCLTQASLTLRATAREAGTAEEDKAAVIGNLALFGTYTVDGEGNFTGNLVQGCTFPNWIGDQRTAKQLKEIVDGDHMREIFQSGDVRVEMAGCNRTLVSR